MPTNCANLQVQGCDISLDLGRNIFFSVHQHLEIKISDLTECFLAEVTDKGCPGYWDASV